MIRSMNFSAFPFFTSHRPDLLNSTVAPSPALISSFTATAGAVIRRLQPNRFRKLVEFRRRGNQPRCSQDDTPEGLIRFAQVRDRDFVDKKSRQIRRYTEAQHIVEDKTIEHRHEIKFSI